jgi:integrase/recombinase XerD
MSLRSSARHGTEESAAHQAIVGINAEVHGWCVQALRGTVATHADLAKVPAWPRHAPRATTRLSEHRESRPQASPTWAGGP